MHTCDHVPKGAPLFCHERLCITMMDTFSFIVCSWPFIKRLHCSYAPLSCADSVAHVTITGRCPLWRSSTASYWSWHKICIFQNNSMQCCYSRCGRWVTLLQLCNCKSSSSTKAPKPHLHCARCQVARSAGATTCGIGNAWQGRRHCIVQRAHLHIFVALYFDVWPVHSARHRAAWPLDLRDRNIMFTSVMSFRTWVGRG
jgi:hypothetical protein